jgi:hypothetical protein
MLNITIHRKVMANIRKKWVFFINIKKNCVNAKFLRDLDPHAPVKQYFLSLSRLPLSLSHYSIIEADKDAADSDAGFLVRVHPDPILIRAQIRAVLCALKSKFIRAQTLTLTVLDKKTGLRARNAERGVSRNSTMGLIHLPNLLFKVLIDN